MEEFFTAISEKGALYGIGQIIGVIAIGLAFAIYTQKDRKKLVVFKLIADALNVAQHSFCGTYAGAATSVVMCFRDFVFLYRGERKWADSRAWLFVFEAFILISPFLTSQAAPFTALWYINGLPALGSGIATVGLYNKKAVVARFLSMIGIALILVYVIVLQNYIQILSNGISIVASLIGLFGDYRRKKSLSSKEEV